MPVDAVCSHCGAEYRLKDRMAGRKIPCRKCNRQFTASSSPASHGQTHRQRQPTVSSAEFRDVQRGVGLAYLSVIVIILSALALQAAAAMTRSGAAPRQLILFPLFFLVIGNILSIVGHFRCLSVPPACHAKFLIFTVVCTELSGVFLRIIGTLSASQPLTLFADLLLTVSCICFLLFLRQVSQRIGDQISVSRVRVIFVCGLGFIPVAWIGVLLIRPLLLLAFVMLLVGFVTWLMLLHRLTGRLKTATIA